MSKRPLGLVYLISAICFALQSFPSVVAQGGEQRARKFDEFGDILASDLIARLDNRHTITKRDNREVFSGCLPLAPRPAGFE